MNFENLSKHTETPYRSVLSTLYASKGDSTHRLVLANISLGYSDSAASLEGS
ncbi:hypothetical protein LOD73_01835 [Xylella fastidiosa subsp. multiplex]|uniref:hypothetical protein n=1 Tax=Xylella fastidiosa TaxID=2371 RepID=UPI00031E26CC|nr:hypothetical protein [Xylella fastidiosa]MBE0277998.1 hypothetical protein [Xylella fastidiosa subsp. multiplex]MBS9445005.1 hypothetical protein [Xylella fastidiosa subsp. multiplex]MBS9446774.1 hypothetical protein [Xylella fastidiosa subsp. multiplex]MDC6414129.1 hypothetical protein [Xylella fastidiosa subsp. multiplex]MDD0864781.1 hypothetical protein [Xylella fastidiosa subsp. multiplex]